MIENQKIRPAQVIGPLAAPLTSTRCRLRRPPAGWCGARRKWSRRSMAACSASMRRASATASAWKSLPAGSAPVDRSGMPGLRVTRIQHYKSLYERQQKY